MNLLKYSRLLVYGVLILIILLPFIACPEELVIKTILTWFMFLIYAIIAYKTLINLEKRWKLLENIDGKKQANNEEKKG